MLQRIFAWLTAISRITRRSKKADPIAPAISNDDAGRARPADAERQDAVEQYRIIDAVVLGGGRELLDLGDLRIGIGFDVVGDALAGKPEIDAGIAVELEGAIDALGRALDPGDELRGEVLGRPDLDAVLLLVLQVVLDLLGGDRAGTLR